MKKSLLILIALALASASAIESAITSGIDVSISASPGVDINIWLNGELWNGDSSSSWTDEDGTIFNSIFLDGKLHEKSIIWINGTQAITMAD